MWYDGIKGLMGYNHIAFQREMYKKFGKEAD